VGALEDSMKWESFEVGQLECLWKWDNGAGRFFFFKKSSAWFLKFKIIFFLFFKKLFLITAYLIL
jgi:hypothetical protein